MWRGMEADKKYDIKHVAIYLRKSRDEETAGDGIDILDKHRDTLTVIAQSNGWTWQEYKEIESGADIERRPEMKKLLDDVVLGLFDGVLVVDIDRLSRGGTRDWADIYDSFKSREHNTLIITPNKVYNLEEEIDEMNVDIQAFLAKYERRTILRRFRRGKAGGARQGRWTNGSPPFPYVYNRDTKHIEPNEQQVPVYRLIVDKYLGGMSTRDIVFFLNKNKIPTPSGVIPMGKQTGWAQNTVTRILKSEVHLGKVVFGKTTGSNSKKEKVKTKSQSEWIYNKEGVTTHKPLKTIEEHEKIILKMKNSMSVHVRARAGITPLSGLIFCKKCSHTIRLMKNRGGAKGEDVHYIALCRYTYKDGSKCSQKGRKCDQEFWDALFDGIIEIDENKIKEAENKTKRKEELKLIIQAKKQALGKNQKAVQRVFQLYEDGDITRTEFSSRKALRDKDKAILEQELRECETELKGIKGLSKQELGKLVEDFKSNWKNALTDKQKNNALKAIVKKITYDRDSETDEVTLEIEYL